MIGAEGAAFELTIVERCLLAGRAIWFYIGKLFWPTELIFIYPRWQVSQAVWWQYLFPAAALLLLAGCWALRRWWRGPLAGLLFFVGTLFPVLGFCNVFPFLYSFVADHFQYLASLGVIALVSAGATLLLKRCGRWNHPVGHAACLVLLVSLGVLTWRQSRIYSDIDSLYRTTIARNPDCWMAHNNLGYALVDRGCIDEAMAQYRRALEIKPDYVEALDNLGVALFGQGRLEEAMAQYQKALAIKPDSAEIHNNLGNALANRGRFDEALAEYRKALEIKPGYVEALNDIGATLFVQGRPDEAMAQYRKALAIKPDYVGARYNLGNALANRGRFDEAMAQYEKVLDIAPDDWPARRNLGAVQSQRQRILESLSQRRKLLRSRPNDATLLNDTAWALATNPNASFRNGKEAVELAQRAVKLSAGQEPAILGTLAAAYAETGRFSEAVKTARTAQKLAAQQKQQTLADTLLAKIALYEAGKPYRQTLPTSVRLPSNP